MSSAGPVREWVGGRLTLPSRIESMGDRKAEMSLWVELPGLQIVGQVLDDPQNREATFGQSLMRAMASPLVGEPRRPQRVRVADAALAEQLQGFSFLSVKVAPTPEFDKVVRSLGAFFGEGSYFSDPVLTPKDIEAFFIAARALWAAHPWTMVEDDALVQVEVPSLGIDDGCLSIAGSLEEVRGFVFFASYEDYERATDGTVRAAIRAPLAGHGGLYFSFDPRDDVPEPMRKEIAEHGWPLADENAYPILLRAVDGKPAPVFAPQLWLATAVMRALGAFVLRHPQAFESSGALDLRESQCDENDLEVILRVPHPLAGADDGPWRSPRAQTLSDQANPYELPLEPHKLQALAHPLGAFTLHRVLGLFCAAASVPQLTPPGAWLAEIMQHAKVADEGQARTVVGQLMVVYNHVITTLDQDDIDGLMPEAADVDACREWARGYTTLVGTSEVAQLEGDAVDAVFGIQALAELPHVLKLLDELHGEDKRETMLEHYRESLADDAERLREIWAEARVEPLGEPPETAFRREAPKVGRNDPCPCGSGKKYKKCCGVG